MMYVKYCPESKLTILSASHIIRPPQNHPEKPVLYNPSFHLLQYFLDCDREVEIERQRLSLFRGSIMFSCVNSPYYSFRPKRTTRAINITFTTNPMKETAENMSSPLSTQKLLYIPFIMDTRENIRIKSAFEDIVKLDASNEELKKLKAEYLLKQLLIDIVLESSDPKEASYYAVQEVINHIEKNPDQFTTIDDLAQIGGMSRSTLIRHFKRYTGKTINQYVIDYKIKKACNIMQEEPYIKVKDISQMLGFCDEYYFSNVFKKVTGISPVEYKHEALGRFACLT